jgi:hypothetical protein
MISRASSLAHVRATTNAQELNKKTQEKNHREDRQSKRERERHRGRVRERERESQRREMRRTTAVDIQFLSVPVPVSNASTYSLWPITVSFSFLLYQKRPCTYVFTDMSVWYGLLIVMINDRIQMCVREQAIARRLTYLEQDLRLSDDYRVDHRIEHRLLKIISIENVHMWE